MEKLLGKEQEYYEGFGGGADGGAPVLARLLARGMLAYIFIVEGIGKIAGYAGVADYM